MHVSPLLLLHGLSACILPQSHAPSGRFHTMTGSYCHSCTCSQMYGPCTSAAHPRCSCPLVMSEPIYRDNLVGYQRCGGAYLLHHTGPAIPVHRSTRFHRSHLHWHPSSEIWVDSILLVPIFFLPAGISYACSRQQTHWLLSGHLSLLLQDVPVRRVVILPLLLRESVLP